MRHLARVFVLLLLLAPGPSFAADKVAIVHKPEYEPGAEYRKVTETKLDQTLTLGGMAIPTKVESYSAVRETVGEPTPEQKIQFHGKFEYFIVNLETLIGKYAFDSSKEGESPDTPPALKPLDELFRATADAKWTSVLNSKPEFESIAFDGEPFGGLQDASKQEVTPEKFVHEANLQLRRFPDGPVAVGDTWKRTEDSQIGNGQVLTFEREFTYLGAEDRGGRPIDRIGVKSLTVEYALGDGGPQNLKLEGSDLKVASSEGAMIYDRQQGLFTESSERVRITGKLDLSIEINGQKQKLPGELDLTIDTKLTSERVSR